MKKISTAFILFCFLTLSYAAQAEDLKSILQNHYDAMGVEKIAAATTAVAVADLDMSGVKTFMKMSIKNEDKVHVQMRMNGQNMTMIVNGDNGIMKIDQTTIILDESQKKDIVGQINLEGDLYNYAEKGHKVTLRGQEKIDGKDYYLLDVVMKDEEDMPMVMFINAKSYLLERTEVSFNENGQPMLLTLNVLDYIRQNGMVIPSKITSTVGTEVIMDMTISEVEFNKALDDSMFFLN